MARNAIPAALAWLALVLASAATLAQLPGPEQPGSHEIELVVFRRDGRGPASEELPRAAAPLALASGSAVPEPLGSLRLDGVASALRRTAGTTVLYHGGWRQVLGTAERTRVTLPGAGLLGSVGVGRERFIHVDVQLALAAPDGLPLAAGLLRERRRMRPGEVHYLDSPLLGVIITVRPPASPDPPTQD